MYEEGEITIAECSECGESFPVFVFVADTDMVTVGCLAFTTVAKSIVLAEQLPGESPSSTAARLGPDVHSVSVRYEGEVAPRGLSFQEFRKVYKPATPIYQCIYCGGDSLGLSKMSKEQFLATGEIRVVSRS